MSARTETHSQCGEWFLRADYKGRLGRAPVVPWSSIIGNEEEFGKSGCRDRDVGVFKLVVIFFPVSWSSARRGEESGLSFV